jgi:hypothetical protein
MGRARKELRDEKTKGPGGLYGEGRQRVMKLRENQKIKRRRKQRGNPNLWRTEGLKTANRKPSTLALFAGKLPLLVVAA